MPDYWIPGVYDLVREWIFPIIFGLAAVEAALLAWVGVMMREHRRRMLDSTLNILKGFRHAPDFDSTKHLHDQVSSVLEFISRKVRTDPEARHQLRDNLRSVANSSHHSKYFRVERVANVVATLVQVFPLLGILGTVVAIAGTTLVPGEPLSPSEITEAFVLALSTTIVRLIFAVIFLVIEGALRPDSRRAPFRASSS
jgi:biopolymer transport protein ExbB/TolQ